MTYLSQEQTHMNYLLQAATSEIRVQRFTKKETKVQSCSSGFSRVVEHGLMAKFPNLKRTRRLVALILDT